MSETRRKIWEIRYRKIGRKNWRTWDARRFVNKAEAERIVAAWNLTSNQWEYKLAEADHAE